MNNVRVPVTSDRGWCWPEWATSIVPGFLYMVGSFFIDNHGKKSRWVFRVQHWKSAGWFFMPKESNARFRFRGKIPAQTVKSCRKRLFLKHKMALRNPKNSGEKEKRWSTAWQRLIEYVRKQSRYISKKRRVHLNFCAESMRSSRGCLVIT